MNARGLTATLLCLTAAALTGCGTDMSNLQAELERIKARKSGQIEPIPQLRTFESFAYRALGRRGPLTPDQRARPAAPDSADAPNSNRVREPLEAYPLDSLRMVGTLRANGREWALIRASDGVVHRVGTGNHLGQNYGQVLAIEPAAVLLRETVPNGLGGWTERATALALSD
ncbi:MAG: pilus assembly protein PilP [Pseudomonadota bacterium]|nr:pilus assembly protein PilP [Pseudomonadota bacterium]HJO36776.1 pilus assembly protein PilP [Gammaproteobacteria bacterium]